MKGRSLSNDKKKTKRWVLPAGREEKLLIATTSRPRRETKIILKVLGNLDEHLTISIKEDGTFDLHHTMEGKEKMYIPLAKGQINLAKLSRAVEDFQKGVLIASRNSIDITDQTLRDLIFLIPKSPELIDEFYSKYYPIKKRKQVYPDRKTQRGMIRDFHHYFHMGYSDEVKDLKFGFSFLIDPDDGSIKFLFNNEGKCCVLDAKALVDILPNCFEIKTRYCYRCGTEVPLSSGWCPTCRKRIRKLREAYSL